MNLALAFAILAAGIVGNLIILVMLLGDNP